jgi:hypothetical protein
MTGFPGVFFVHSGRKASAVINRAIINNNN